MITLLILRPPALPRMHKAQVSLRERPQTERIDCPSRDIDTFEAMAFLFFSQLLGKPGLDD
jgi:hypothetical protein